MIRADQGQTGQKAQKYDSSSVAARRYTATDHKSFDQSLKHCPAGAFCRNCMPINDTADHCWAVKTPILYKVKSYGKIESKNKGDIVSHIAVSLHFSSIRRVLGT